jgi:hypothetical protein
LHKEHSTPRYSNNENTSKECKKIGSKERGKLHQLQVPLQPSYSKPDQKNPSRPVNSHCQKFLFQENGRLESPGWSKLSKLFGQFYFKDGNQDHLS